jgi:hypothetical protein
MQKSRMNSKCNLKYGCFSVTGNAVLSSSYFQIIRKEEKKYVRQAVEIIM